MRTLSVHRSFVVRLYDDAKLSNGELGGQVEHVLSGEGGEFLSIEELLRLMQQALDTVPSREEAIQEPRR